MANGGGLPAEERQRVGAKNGEANADRRGDQRQERELVIQRPIGLLGEELSERGEIDLGRQECEVDSAMRRAAGSGRSSSRWGRP